MAQSVVTINVATSDESQQSIIEYVAKGYATTAQTGSMTTLTKKGGALSLIQGKNFLIFALGILACVIPGIVWAFYVIAQGDKVVVIRVDPAAAEAAARVPQDGPIWSEDRRYWWNGSAWVDSQLTAPTEDVGPEVFPPSEAEGLR